MDRGIQDEWAADAALAETHDDLLRQRILDELSAEEWLDDAGVNIQVTVLDGTAILQGTVNTESQRKQAEAIASEAGAGSVRSELRIKGR